MDERESTRDRLESELTGLLAESGLDLEAVDLNDAGRRRILRIAVDKDGGVSMDDIAVAAKQISAALDASGVLGEHAYTLEVTSRGVERPLTLPRHWRRNTGRLVTIKFSGAGRNDVTGRIRSSDDTSVTLDVAGADHTAAYADVAQAKIQIEFDRKTVTEN